MEKQYIFTERAHLMCPRMCFGIAVTVRSPFDEQRVRDSFRRLSAAHPFLNALLGHEEKTNRFYYNVTDSPRTELFFKPGNGAPSRADITAEFDRLTAKETDLTKHGMLRVSVWDAGGQTVFLLVFHHLLADGRAALSLAEQLADLYAEGKSPESAPERLISSVKDMPEDSRMPFVSRALVNYANRQRAKESGRLTYSEYLRLADSFLENDPVSHTIHTADSAAVAKMSDECRAGGYTVNDRLLADMFIRERADSVTIACDLRERLGITAQGALGNCSTAFSVVLKGKKRGAAETAKAVHEIVQKKLSSPRELYLVLQFYAAVTPELLDEAFVSSREGYAGKSGRFIGDRFLGYGAAKGHCVTNLGRCENGCISSAFFIPPASPAMKKTLGVLTMNGEMTICTSERNYKVNSRH